MNLLMVTNTYLPHVGGVANSVHAFAREYRRRGHRVVVLAPEFTARSDDEEDVIRVPSIPNFNDSGFSLSLPIPGFVSAALADVSFDLVHSHHPFLLGGTALRLAAHRDVPLVFTHHTRFEHYTHYVPGDSEALGPFILGLTRGYANLCDQLIAPSESIRDEMLEQDVHCSVTVIPTGVDVGRFQQGDGAGLRQTLGIPATAEVVGHVGRLAAEKNLDHLGAAVVRLLSDCPEVWFMVAGDGPAAGHLSERLRQAGVGSRVRPLGVLGGQDLVDAYHAMDAFAFSSRSETQGMVLIEAMAAGVPVVALDAPGAREVVRTDENGWLLPGSATAADLAAALEGLLTRSPEARQRLAAGARATAARLSLEVTAEAALDLYARLVRTTGVARRLRDHGSFDALLRDIEAEWDLWSNLGYALAAGLGGALGYPPASAPERA